MSAQCTACKAPLVPVFDEETPYQFRDALWVGFHGGYAMFVDNLDVNPLWGDPSSRVLPGPPDYEALLCKTCADALVSTVPWLLPLLTGGKHG